MFKKYADEMMDFVKKIEADGPRLPGSDEEKAACKKIQGEILDRTGLSSKTENFMFAPVAGIGKKNIEQGNFRIVPTKRGDYIFKLLNGNNQLLCLGEHYKTRRMCQNAVESVKRFALTSPTVVDEE